MPFCTDWYSHWKPMLNDAAGSGNIQNNGTCTIRKPSQVLSCSISPDFSCQHGFNPAEIARKSPFQHNLPENPQSRTRQPPEQAGWFVNSFEFFADRSFSQDFSGHFAGHALHPSLTKLFGPLSIITRDPAIQEAYRQVHTRLPKLPNFSACTGQLQAGSPADEVRHLFRFKVCPRYTTRSPAHESGCRLTLVNRRPAVCDWVLQQYVVFVRYDRVAGLRCLQYQGIIQPFERVAQWRSRCR